MYDLYVAHEAVTSGKNFAMLNELSPLIKFDILEDRTDEFTCREVCNRTA